MSNISDNEDFLIVDSGWARDNKGNELGLNLGAGSLAQEKRAAVIDKCYCELACSSCPCVRRQSLLFAGKIVMPQGNQAESPKILERGAPHESRLGLR
jgi:hypothetical protein